MFFCLCRGFGLVGGVGVVVIGVTPFILLSCHPPLRTPLHKPSARLKRGAAGWKEARVNDSLRDPLTHPV